MKKILLVLIAAFAICGSVFAQYPSYWPDFSNGLYENQDNIVAAIIIDGHIITIDDEGWDAYEVAPFVGEECRGNNMFLFDGVTTFGDLYPTLDGYPIYYNDMNEVVTFKMYDHLNGILYEDCEILYLGEPYVITTGTDHLEGWADPENPIFLSFTSPAYELTVNDGTETNYQVPLYGLWADQFSKSQFIIPSDDLTVMAYGTIDKLTFYSNSAEVSWGAAEFEVYMTEVDYTTFESATLVDWTTMDKVKNASSLAIIDNQMVIELDATYHYLGGNLLIGILETTKGSFVSCTWYGVTQEGVTALGGYEDSRAISTQSFLPKTSFNYTPGEAPECERPTGLTVSDVTAHTAELSWTAGGDDTAWQVLVNDGEPIDVTTNSYSLEGLDGETEYAVRVRADCGDGSYSDWSIAQYFTTLIACPAPTDLAETFTPGNGSEVILAWTENGTATEWVVAYKTTDEEDFTEITNVTVNPYTLAGLTPETTYNVKVKAVCGGDDGASIWSNVVTFTPTDAYLLTVNDGTNTNGYIPVYGFYVDQFSKSQFIIPADDLTAMAYGTINKLTFYASQANINWGAAEFEVYMTEVDYTTFEETTLIDWTSMDQVMNASTLGVSDNVMEVTLDAPYQYLGGNLMIGIKQTTKGSYMTSTWYGVSQESVTALGGYENSKAIGAQSFLPKTTFAYEPGEAPSCFKPTGLAVNYTGGLTAEVSWTSEATAWNIDVNGTIIPVTANPYTLTVELATTYEVSVQADCGGDLSEWTNPVTFTTDECMPENQIVFNYELTDSWGDGWNGNAILVVDETCNIVKQLTIENGASNNGSLRVCGSYAAFYWNKGSYPTETSWVFTDAVGDTLFFGTGTNAMQTLDLLYAIDLNQYAAPSDIEVSEVSNHTAKVSWTENGTATVWQIMLNGDEDNLIEANTNPFTLTGLDPETEYTVNVRAVGTEGTSMWPCLYADFTTLEPCPAPTELTATRVTATSATLNWEGFGETYNVSYAPVNPDKVIELIDLVSPQIALDDIVIKGSAMIWIDLTGVSGNSIEITGLGAETEYMWKVQSDCGVEDGTSLWSNSTFTTSDFCETPFDLEAINVNYNAATLTWAGSQESYNVRYRTAARAGEWVEVTATTTTLDMTDLVPGTEYEWQVQGINTDCEELEWSEIATFTTLDGQTFTKDIIGYGTGEGNWYLIASPIDGIAPADVTNMIADPEEDYDLFIFQQVDYQEWRNYKFDMFVLEAGKGYLYANKEDVTLTFFGVPYNGDGDVVLEKVDNAIWSGWNLVGNPFAETVYIGDRDFYIMNFAGDEIIKSTSPSIEPMEGVFVIAENDGEMLTFNTEGPAKSAMLSLNLSQGRNIVDCAAVRFGVGRSLPKLQLNPNHTKVYFTMDDEDYAVVRSEGMGEIPVSFKAESNGSYTLSFAAEEVSFNYLHLIDNMTGADVDLLVNPSYSFEANTTDYASRFKLVFATGSNSDDNFAFYSNGSFVISNEGEAVLQVVDVTGRILNNKTINGSANVHVDVAPGVYMLRLINGDNVKVQKVVVR